VTGARRAGSSRPHARQQLRVAPVRLGVALGDQAEAPSVGDEHLVPALRGNAAQPRRVRPDLEHDAQRRTIAEPGPGGGRRGREAAALAHRAGRVEEAEVAVPVADIEAQRRAGRRSRGLCGHRRLRGEKDMAGGPAGPPRESVPPGRHLNLLIPTEPRAAPCPATCRITGPAPRSVSVPECRAFPSCGRWRRTDAWVPGVSIERLRVPHLRHSALLDLRVLKRAREQLPREVERAAAGARRHAQEVTTWLRPLPTGLREAEVAARRRARYDAAPPMGNRGARLRRRRLNSAGEPDARSAGRGAGVPSAELQRSPTPLHATRRRSTRRADLGRSADTHL
jgi:hypothetical protein